jgi:hypothetical protein
MAYLLNDVGLNAFRRLVEQQNFGPRNQRARDGKI